MVVELGPVIRALGTYPGGQSGNPASARYTDRMRFWKDGDLELLTVPAAADSLSCGAGALAPHPLAGEALTMTALRMLMLAIAIALGTILVGWWTVPLVAVVYGVLLRGSRYPGL